MVKSATVLVLGDMGRSPRMQYHCLSLANEGFFVDFVGYNDSPCCQEVETHSRIRKRSLRPFPALPRRLFLVYAPFKILFQILQLLWTLLWSIPRMDVLLVQNPPAIPSLLIAVIVSRLRGSLFVLDWHNFGWSILALRRSPAGFLVRCAKWYEWRVGRMAHRHLCVSLAMSRYLQRTLPLATAPVVLHDKPPASFGRLSLSERHEFFERFSHLFDGGSDGGSPFTSVRADGTVVEKSDRPALLVSSTSWTPDEDFSILLDAITQLDALAGDTRMVFVITGEGNQRAMYEGQISKLKLRRCVIRTWYFAKRRDYARLLGSADMGICLHTSSSGLDLPMKVVDMFGCGLPVCAFEYDCLGELVRDGENGRVFDNAARLCTILQDLFASFPQERSDLDALRDGVSLQTWESSWRQNALPLFD